MNEDIDAARAAAHERATGRLDTETASSELTPTVVGEIGDAEAGNLRIRLIAIENILVALLATASESQVELIRDMARYISPRSGKTPHRLTVEAARNMLAILERAEHYRRLT